MWSKNYTKCKKCNSSENRHCAFGLCIKCYKYNYHKTNSIICSKCNKLRPLSTNKKGKPICKNCFKKYYFKIKPKKCNVCNKVKRIDKLDNGKRVCVNCYGKYYYKRKKDLCSRCKTIQEIMNYNKGLPICGSCYRINFYKKKKKLCSKCNCKGYINKIINNKLICGSCYKKMRRFHYSFLDHVRKVKAKNNGVSITENDFIKIKARDINCVYCNSKENLCFDHIIPISKGGRSEYTNYVLACRSCNSSKGNKDVFDWCKIKNRSIPDIIKKLRTTCENRTHAIRTTTEYSNH